MGMTRKEAIKALEARLTSDDVIYVADISYPQALAFAINELKAQEPEALDMPKPDSEIGCWYDITHNYTLEQVVSALKAQEPRVMTLDEVKSCGNPVWLEWNYYFIKPALLHSEEVMTDDNRKAVTFVLFGDEEWYIYADDDYGKEIRCWTSRPTDEQREKVKWDG